MPVVLVWLIKSRPATDENFDLTAFTVCSQKERAPQLCEARSNVQLSEEAD
jgi:hypothetical protein